MHCENLRLEEAVHVNPSQYFVTDHASRIRDPNPSVLRMPTTVVLTVVKGFRSFELGRRG